jgi:hypothetical protein
LYSTGGCCEYRLELPEAVTPRAVQQRIGSFIEQYGCGLGSSIAMHEFWKQFAVDSALERFMAAVESQAQPSGPPDVSVAIQLANKELLQRQVPLGDVADAAWALRSQYRDGSTHDLALVTAYYFLQRRALIPRQLEPIRFEARLIAQQWMTEGLASVTVVTRFEEALFQQFW